MNYESPLIKVTWEDSPENFTKEKMKLVKTHFQQKYNTKTVTIIPKSIINNTDLKLKSLEASDQILDTNFQKKLMKNFIEENKMEVNWELLDRLDNKVNAEVGKLNENKVKYNKWYIKCIEFSNFLSYGDDNSIDYTTFEGITVVESTPRNFGGKTTLLDLLLFLFFNSTTKTKTMGEIFNRFRDENKVFVKGVIVIDEEDYIIERTLTRKKGKNDDYTVKSNLQFFKIKSDGSIENLNGEQRTETETFISSAIGTEEDFLTTIMTTGGNLEQLIESKPTARGQILTKFLGLENLKIKEEACKTIESKWSKNLVSNTYNQVTLESDNKIYHESIELSKQEIININKEQKTNNKTLSELEKEKEELLSNKSTDVDMDLIRTNPDTLRKEKEKLIKEKNDVGVLIGSINVTEPKTYYYENEHEELKTKMSDIAVKGKLKSGEIETNNKSIKDLKDGEFCPTCKQSLKDIDHTDEIEKLEKENEELNKIVTQLRSEYEKLNTEEKFYKNLKLEYDEYEKNKIIKSKHELSLGEKELELSKIDIKLEKYDINNKKFQENKKIEERLTILKTQIDSINGTIRTNISKLEKHDSNIINLTEKIDINKKLIKDIKSEIDTSHIFKIYLMIYGKNGISKVIMKNMIPLLNQELYTLLEDSCPFILELNVNDKNEVEFIMIDSETRIIKPLSSGSGYEKTISSLALRSVLTKISSLPKPNIVIMDEIFGKVADENLELVGEFFKKIKEYFEHIILISHNPLIRNWSDNLIMVKKEENISHIDYIKIKST